jgi:hypothetical protein
MPSLRIIYDNLADSGTVTATSTAGSLAATNMQIDKKSKVWRSVGTTATLKCSWSSSKSINSIVFAFCNFSSTATVVARLYDTTVGGTPLYTSPSTLITPSVSAEYWGNGSQPLGVNSYSYGFTQHARLWLANTYTTVKRIELDVTDTSNTSGYLEVSRLILGNYWAPTYNTGFGIPMTSVDAGTQTRAQSGDLVSSVSYKYKKLSIDLAWMLAPDRVRLQSMLQNNGISKGVFLSVFPEDTDPFKEQTYQIYGKLPNSVTISHPMHTIYSTQIELEEV